MKRIIPALLALVLLAASLPALAESTDTGALPEGGIQLAKRQVALADLDGDGVEEAVSWTTVPDEYASDEHLALTVGDAAGNASTYETEILYGEAVYIVDLDGDGAREILLTGDEMSDDYCTWCLHYANGALHEVLFPDSGRDDNADGYFKIGYGLIEGFTEGGLILAGSQDVLGTWFGARTLKLSPWERFEFDDDGLWVRLLPDVNDPDLWEYGALTLKVSLPYSDLRGNPAGTLEPGDRILICASDKREVAHFITQSGAKGVLAISTDYEQGWGWLVEGIQEADCFEYVPYAD